LDVEVAKETRPPSDGMRQLSMERHEVEAFDIFFDREFVALVGLAEAVSGDPGDAEDLAAEAMTRAHKNWARVAQLDKPAAWVRRVTINLAIGRRRRRNRQRRILRSVRPAVVGPPEPHHPVWAAVAQLPPKQRAAVALHYLEDLPVAEIAEVLECAVSTATSHLYEGRKKLAKLLENGDWS